MSATMTPAELAAWVGSLTESGQARQLRRNSGYTLAEAARKCGGVYPSAVLRWERGMPPRGRNLQAYARFLRRLGAEPGSRTDA